MLGTVVVGAIFTDIKGFPSSSYAPRERNLGRVEFVNGGVCRNIAEDIASSGMPVTFVSMTEKSALGTEVVNRLHECGVNTEFMENYKELMADDSYADEDFDIDPDDYDQQLAEEAYADEIQGAEDFDEE